MAEFLLDTDPVNKAWNTIELDGDTVIIRRYWESEDVNAILDANQQEANHGTTSRDDFMRRTARIPDIVIYEWLDKFGVRAWDKNHQKKVHELLNSNEFYKLRTGGGHL